MRRALLCMAVLALMATPVFAGRIADSLAFQGRMTNASDLPVTGSQLVILSIWSDSTGGTMLHIEDQTVQFTNGLFSVCVGCVGAGLDDSVFSMSPRLWLQVQISGEPPMSTRSLFRSNPRAVTSSRVLGDISTSRNRLAVGDLNGDGRLDLLSKPDTTGFTVEKVASFKSRSGNMVVLDDRASISLKTYQPGQPSYGNITFEASDGHVSNYLDCDDDGDGVSDSRITTTAGSGGGGGGAGGSILLEADLDGDGVLESSTSSSASSSTVQYKATQGKTGKAKTCKMAADEDSAYTEVSMDIGTDGVLDNSISSSADLSSAKHAINTKGTGTSGRSISSSTSQTHATILIEADLDGDGQADNFIGGDCDDTDSELRVAHELSHVVQQRAGAATAMCVASGDLDGDGVLESSTGVTIEGNSVSYTARQGKSGKTKRCASTADESGASSVVAVDLDQDGIDELSIDDDCDDISAERKIRVTNIGSSGQDGVEVTMRYLVDSMVETGTITDGGVALYGYSAKAGKTGSASGKRCIDPGTGSSSQTDQLITADSLVDEAMFTFTGGGGLPVLMKAKEKANRTKCGSNLRCTTGGNTVETDVSCDTASARSSWAASSPISGDSVVIQASTSGATNPIEHSSGAHLTAGGVWTNASDVNLKENFRAVDGEEILEKVEELPISQWNYKVESEEVTHIGPTAQDFKQVFGVGGNDKTISTIDPSGVALAAIKELGRQNRELKEENKKMKELLEALSKKVDQLASEKN